MENLPNDILLSIADFVGDVPFVKSFLMGSFGRLAVLPDSYFFQTLVTRELGDDISNQVRDEGMSWLHLFRELVIARKVLSV